MFLACSYSLERCSTNRPWVPVFIGVNEPMCTVSFGALQDLPVYFPFFVYGAGGCWLACCILAPALVLYHHPVWSYFDGAFLLGTWGKQERGREMLFTHTHYLNISIFSAVVKYRWKAASPEATGRGSGRIYPSLRKVYTCCPPFFVLDLTATPIISEICHNPPSPFSSNITYDSNPNVERYGFIWKLFYSQDVKEGF